MYYIALRFEWGVKFTLYKWTVGLRLYAHGITRYSVKYFLHRVWSTIKWLVGIGLVAYILITGPAYVYGLVRTWIAENLVNPAQFFTEALVLLIVELPILYLVSRVAGESKSPVARLQAKSSRPNENKEDGSLILGLNVTNIGEVAAVSCEARLTFELRSDHLVNSTTQAILNRDNFKPPLRTKVP